MCQSPSVSGQWQASSRQQDRHENSCACLFGLLIFLRLYLSQTSISGVWLLNGPGTESAIQLTPLGEQIRADYDLLVDDPSLSCTPASARIWANPTRIKIPSRPMLLRSARVVQPRRHIPLETTLFCRIPRAPKSLWHSVCGDGLILCLL